MKNEWLKLGMEQMSKELEGFAKELIAKKGWRTSKDAIEKAIIYAFSVHSVIAIEDIEDAKRLVALYLSANDKWERA